MRHPGSADGRIAAACLIRLLHFLHIAVPRFVGGFTIYGYAQRLETRMWGKDGH